MSTRRAWLLVPLAAAALLAACVDDEGGSIEGPTWTLVSYVEGGGQQAVPAGVEATATFADGTVQGSSGCNSFSGSYEVSGDGLTFGPLASTLMACEPPEGIVESVVFGGLEATTSYRVQGGTLTLLDEAGAELLVFEETAT